MKVLLAIWYYNDVKGLSLSLRRIGDLLKVRSAVSRIYRKLERDGLIRIETDKRKRSRIAHITFEGIQKLHEEFPHLLEILDVVKGESKLYAQR